MSFRKQPETQPVMPDLPRAAHRRRSAWAIWVVLILALAVLLRSAAYLRSASADTALSDARDSVTNGVHASVIRVLRDGNYGYGAFVTLEKDAEGNITAVVTDTARVNVFASEVLLEIAEAARDGMFDVRIPLGSLLGSDLLLGRGPEIPVRISMMTSPDVRFQNDFSAAGINQTRHALTLLTRVDVDIFVPWGAVSTAVETEVLIAETVLLGRVPQTYIQTQ